MGQQITVTARAGASPGVRFFDCNRSLTSMEIERYPSAASAGGPRPPDVLARRLFELGASSVSVYSNVVTVEAPAERWGELEQRVIDTIEYLFLYYGDRAGWSPEARGVEAQPSKVR
ncbi:MAG: hypothetical protein U0V73_06595 [Acidimicrobiia bacterium]